jgi:hypothetical protein
MNIRKGPELTVDLMMAFGAAIILIVGFQFLDEFRKTRRVRLLIVALVTLPVGLFLLAFALRVVFQ